MSNVHIKRAVENIKSGTTIYTPVIELIVNAIQAIESMTSAKPGCVTVAVSRSPQLEMQGEDSSIPAVESFLVEDNGIGFDDVNRDAFDTLYTDNKISQGGKGFGRFTCLKYFENVEIDSTFVSEGALKRRQFEMGKQTEIIVNERIGPAIRSETGTLIRLESAKKAGLDKKLSTIARALVEKLLPYLIAENYVCPRIVLKEADASEEVVLNDYLHESSAVISEIRAIDQTFSFDANGSTYDFKVRIFKFFSPRNAKSKISLVAHNREVTEVPTQSYIPEFSEDFYEKGRGDAPETGRNYVVKTYVFGEYLNKHVSLERGGFEFQKEHDALHGISQFQIEKKAAELTQCAISAEVLSRQQKKAAQITSYVEHEAPWHRTIIKKVDLSQFPYNPSHEEIEARLQEEKFKDEVKIRRDVNRILNDASVGAFESGISDIVERISETSKNDLVHYVALRKNVLALFEKSLQLAASNNYKSEGFVHDIIFPRGKDSESVGYEDHNLWLIDERLNFTRYLSSDVPLNGAKTERPDIICFDHPFAYRGDNEPSNPVTIFEFKKPQRDDFANAASKEDPIEQIVRYVNNIQDGKFKTPQGRSILVAENTPFYGYVVCDLTEKVKTWLKRQKNFKVMPDALGWFNWYDNINLYIEVLSWDKVLKDAGMRNRAFFHKLGI
ncbi:ATP-binding protein [Luteimonas sp. MC1828]|uniref:ATP-binding protein n=1 Tax=Luteimonas sp. MC1828 TaxID=2799787 RepID=UPI0018F1E508|nr:ATP-binding protein [Luteimonas sp. MC1828]MBJ7575665.1 sensor histidine kinase [Luteimonas sp. MC1828]